MKALNQKEGFKLLSEFVILVIETFQGQMCNAAPLWKGLFVVNNCQLPQHRKPEVWVQRKEQFTSSRVRADYASEQTGFWRSFKSNYP